MIRKIVLAISLLLFMIMAGRNYLAKYFVNYYLVKKLHLHVSVDRVFLGIDHVSLYDVKYDSGSLQFFCSSINAGIFFNGIKPEISFFSIDGGYVKSSNIELAYNLSHIDGGLHELFLDRLKINDKIVKNIRLPFTYWRQKKISVIGKNIIFGPDATWDGVIFYEKNGVLTVDINIYNLSLSELYSFVIQKSDGYAEGKFSSVIKAGFQGGHPVFLEALFENIDSGRVVINKDMPLAYLNQYLDQDSCKLLIEGLRDYKYNKSIITASLLANDLVVKAGFDSSSDGKRDLTVVFHNVGGRREAK